MNDHGKSKRERRHFTGQQKVAIVKAHLIDGVSISDLCDQHQIQPTQFHSNCIAGGRHRLQSHTLSRPAGPSTPAKPADFED